MFVKNTTSYINDRPASGGSGIHMGFMGLKIKTKSKNVFLHWVVMHNSTGHSTVQ